MSTTGIAKRHWPRLKPPLERDALPPIKAALPLAREKTIREALAVIEANLQAMPITDPDRKLEQARADTLRRFLR